MTPKELFDTIDTTGDIDTGDIDTGDIDTGDIDVENINFVPEVPPTEIRTNDNTVTGGTDTTTGNIPLKVTKDIPMDNIAKFDFYGAIDHLEKLGVDNPANDILKHLESSYPDEYDWNKAREEGKTKVAVLEELMYRKVRIQAHNNSDYYNGLLTSLTGLHILGADIAQGVSEIVESGTGWDMYDDEVYNAYVKDQQKVASIIKESIENPDDFFTAFTAGQISLELMPIGNMVTGAKIGSKLYKARMLAESKLALGLTYGALEYARTRAKGDDKATSAMWGGVAGVGGVALGEVFKGISNIFLKQGAVRSQKRFSELNEVLTREHLTTQTKRDAFEKFLVDTAHTTEDMALGTTISNRLESPQFKSQALVQFLANTSDEGKVLMHNSIAGNRRATEALRTARQAREELLIGLSKVDKLDDNAIELLEKDWSKHSQIVKDSYGSFIHSIADIIPNDLSHVLPDKLVNEVIEELGTTTLSTTKKTLGKLQDNIVEGSMESVLGALSDVSTLLRKNLSSTLRSRLANVKRNIENEIKGSLIARLGEKQGLKVHEEFLTQRVAYARMKNVESSKLGELLIQLGSKAHKGKKGAISNEDYILDKLYKMELDDTVLSDMTSLVGSKGVERLNSLFIKKAINDGSIDSINTLHKMVIKKGATPEVKLFVDTLSDIQRLFADDLKIAYGTTIDNVSSSKVEVVAQASSMVVKPLVIAMAKQLPVSITNQIPFLKQGIMQDNIAKAFKKPAFIKAVVDEIEHMTPAVRSQYFRNILEQVPRLPAPRGDTPIHSTPDGISKIMSYPDGTNVPIKNNVAKSFNISPLDIDFSRVARQKLKKKGITSEGIISIQAKNDEIRAYTIQLEITKAQQALSKSKDIVAYEDNILPALSLLGNNETLQQGVKAIQSMKYLGRDNKIPAQIKFTARKVAREIKNKLGNTPDNLEEIITEILKSHKGK